MGRKDPHTYSLQIGGTQVTIQHQGLVVAAKAKWEVDWPVAEV